MKQIWILSYFFEPDLSAGSFRNTSLVKTLLEMTDDSVQLNVITTLPNRYKDFSAKAEAFEDRGRLKIHRIEVPRHANGMGDQVRSYMVFFREAVKLLQGRQVDLVYASSSKLFTGFLGAVVARWKKAPLYLDIRDIFTDTIKDVMSGHPLIRPVHAVMRVIERWTIRQATHLNVISGGFKPYFAYRKGPVTEFTNGIDDLFLSLPPSKPRQNGVRTILYAGNMGEGQGLEKIVPEAAERLGDAVRFRLIGSGGTRAKLEQAVAVRNLTNVSIEDPMPRAELVQAYIEADYLFLHLNDYDAFRKVLPSKIFEYAATDKPVIAGVAGHAADFLRKNVSNLILFDPCDVEGFISLYSTHPFQFEKRETFIKTFNRKAINSRMASSILDILKS
jgi:glycosyltransferase involved in cell wall biosynthesis